MTKKKFLRFGKHAPVDLALTNDPKHPPYITVTQGMSGHFAVCMDWNPEGFYEPFDTHPARRETQEEAIEDAKEWAVDEALEFLP